MNEKVWNCIITRQFRTYYSELNFKEYTDYVAEPTTINLEELGNYILECKNKNVITTISGDFIKTAVRN